MKKTGLVIIALILSIVVNNLKAFDDKEIMQAMRDEIKRTMDSLYLESLEKPYYVEFMLEHTDSRVVRASLGSVLDTVTNERAELDVGLRVGSYELDNSNFFDFAFSFFGSGDDEETFSGRRVPLELDYKNLRRELWLAADAAYKQNSEIYSKKLAVMKNRIRKDTTPDFIQLGPARHYLKKEIPEFDKQYFVNLCKDLSAAFKDYPDIHVSNVLVEYIPKTTYYVNSEGREYIKTDFYLGMEAVAATQADDGMPLAEFYTAFVHNPNNLPSKDSLLKAVKNIAAKLVELKNAKYLDEPYSGPILFEDQAAAEIFAQVFAPNLVTQRQPMTEDGVRESDRYTAFQMKIGGRVLPEFLSLKDIPSLEKFDGTITLGHYQLDDEGVPPKDVSLVEAGYLKNLLSSRVPIRRVKKSNGHKRGGAPMFSVLKLEPVKGKASAFEEMKARMMKLAADRELPYGIIVRKVMNQNIMFTTLQRITNAEYPTPRSESKLAIAEAYKIYPDGREELVRGAEANGFTVQSFKDIIMADKDYYVLNFLAPSVVSAFISGGEQFVGSTVIVPDILFEDGEIRPLESDFPKPPLLKNPIGKK